MTPITFAIQKQSTTLSDDIARVLGAVGAPRSGSSVFVKPNFTYPFEKPGVTTTRRFLVALIEALRDIGVARLCLGEGEGGYNAFSMDETFASYDFDGLRRRYGIEYQNVNRWPPAALDVDTRRGKVVVNVPAPILEEFDHFISVPVPKVHCMTTISCAVKNQWGLVQDTMRLSRHTVFDEVVTAVNRALPSPLAVADGTYGLTRNGPMVDGVTIELGWVTACNDLFAHDAVICELMRIPLQKVAHLRFAQQRGVLPRRQDIDAPSDLAAFVDDRFYLRRNAWNHLAKVTWHSQRLNHLVYTSRASGLLHRVMYSIRKKSPDLRARGVDWD